MYQQQAGGSVSDTTWAGFLRHTHADKLVSIMKELHIFLPMYNSVAGMSIAIIVVILFPIRAENTQRNIK